MLCSICPSCYTASIALCFILHVLCFRCCWEGQPAEFGIKKLAQFLRSDGLVGKRASHDAMVLQNALPDVLCVVQVALEGAVSKKAALNSLAQGNLPQVSPCVSAPTQTLLKPSTSFLLSCCLCALAAYQFAPSCTVAGDVCSSCWCNSLLCSSPSVCPLQQPACKRLLTCCKELKQSATQ